MSVPHPIQYERGMCQLYDINVVKLELSAFDLRATARQVGKIHASMTQLRRTNGNYGNYGKDVPRPHFADIIKQNKSVAHNSHCVLRSL